MKDLFWHVENDPQRHTSPDTTELHILAALNAISRNISPLTPLDAAGFRKIFQQEDVCYSNSWLYLLRATRNDQGKPGYKLMGRDLVMGIGYRKNTLYLVHPMGRFHALLSFCSQLRKKVHCTIVLKKTDPHLYSQLAATGMFQEYEEGLPLFEEEAFPEHVLPLDILYNPQTGLYHRSLPFIRKVRRFENSAIQLRAGTDISNIENSAGFHKLFGFNPDKYASYLPMIQETRAVPASNSPYTVCAYYDEQESMHGLYIAEHLRNETMGLYCAVSSRGAPGMTEWMDYDFFRRLYLDGIHFLYLGGSETAGVHSYVKKLLPISPSYVMQPMKMKDK